MYSDDLLAGTGEVPTVVCEAAGAGGRQRNHTAAPS
jgi:hypothetical protein